jgi:hypothetical protein
MIMNDLSDFLLVASCLFGGLTALLVLLVAIDPETDWAGIARTPARGRGDERASVAHRLVGHRTGSRYSAGRRSVR